jgi:hypothetical protein
MSTLVIESKEATAEMKSAATTEEIGARDRNVPPTVISIAIGGIPSLPTSDVEQCDRPLHGTNWGRLPSS